MARERTPMGKRVVIPVRVSEPMRDAIDEARGDVPRSVWIEDAIAAKLPKAPRLLLKSAAETAAEMGYSVPAAPSPKNCKHPKLRTKGVCPDCQTWVQSVTR